MPELGAGAGAHFGHRPADRVGQRSAVGVAEHERLGPLLLGRRQDGKGEVRVVPVAVEEVLGVEEDAQIVGDEVAHRIAHHGHRFVERGAQRLGDVAVPRLGHDAGDRRAGFDEVGQDGVVLGPHAGPTGRAEGDQGGRGELQLLAGPGEELDVLGVGPGPPALDEGDPQMVELLGHPELVGHGEGEPLLLAPVAQDRVEDVDRLGQVRHLVVVRQVRVRVRPAMRVRMRPSGRGVCAPPRGRGVWPSVDMVQPVLVAIDLAAHGGEVGLLHLDGDRARLPVTHLAVVDGADRHDLGRRPGEERLVGQVEVGADDLLVAHLDSRGRPRSSRPSSG